jgi:hypothetical protein
MSLVLLFTIALFLTYHFLVEKRQKIVLTKAIQATSIVTSLFPQQVHEKLLESQQQKLANSKQPKSALTTKLKDYMSGEVGSSTATVVDRQIAELYPNCTVMFADISGMLPEKIFVWNAAVFPPYVF